MTCRGCQHENLPTMKFCGECGTPLQRPQVDAPPAPSYADMQRVATEALEQQTATAEILRVISTSPTSLQPVLDTLAASAARFCGSYDGSIFHLQGDTLRLDAHHGPLDSHPVGLEVPVVRGAVMGRTVLDREAVHVADLQAETEEFPEGSAIARQLGFHTLLCVPLMREGSAIGAIGLRRIEVSPFTDKQIALAKTFADQAVIAIENVRLFTELQEKNKALTAAHAQVTEALEQQTATSEILRIISQSPTQVEPVFHALIASAIRLARGDYGGIELLQNDVWYLAASEGLGEGLATFRRIFPLSLEQSGLMKDAVTTRTPMHTPNVFEDPRVGPFARQLASAARYHALIHVPLLGRDVVMGLLTVIKREPGPFSANEVALLRTFAD